MKTSPTSTALNCFPQPPTSAPYWHWDHHPDVVQPINGKLFFYSSDSTWMVSLITA